MTGGGQLTLTSSSAYSGTTTISSGTLLAMAPGALGTGSSIVLGDANTGASPVQLATSGAMSLGQSMTIKAANATLANLPNYYAAYGGNSVAFGGNVVLNNSAGTLSINSNSYQINGDSLTFNGSISSSSTANANAVIVNGDYYAFGAYPTQVLFAGNNSYTGPTTVQNDALLVIGQQRLAARHHQPDHQRQQPGQLSTTPASRWAP